MTINDHISYIKATIGHGIPSDDERLSDRYIFHCMKSVRAILMKQKRDKSNFISSFNFQTLPCVPLERSKLDDCPCVTTDCKVLKTKFKIPEILSYRNGLMINRVYTPAGQEISRTSLKKAELQKYTKVRSNKPGYFFHNGYMVIINLKKLKYVTITAIFKDPIELGDFPKCDESGPTTDTCYDALADDFPLDMDLFSSFYTLIFEKMRVPHLFPIDETNDSLDNQQVSGKQ